MLVIISDLHLTDGTTGKTINPGAFHDFWERLRDLAYDASKRADGRYQPIEVVNLVLLGDVFDLLRSDKWNAEDEGNPNYVRPWDEPYRRRFVQKIDTITAAILEHNAEACTVLRELNGSHPITVPPATRDGKPAYDASEWVPVPVRIYYLVGNHDWYFHLPGAPYDKIRQQVTQTLGLSNPSGPYPHDPATSPELMEIYRQHGVFARHGDIYDSFNYVKEKGRNAATLGDAVVVDLINRFPQLVREELDYLPAPFVDGLNELANVRPSLFVPIWIDGLINHASLSNVDSGKVKQIWNRLADRFLDLPFVRSQDKFLRFDEVDILQLTLRFSREFSFREVARIVTIVREKISGGHESYAHHALTEPSFKNQTAEHIIYGHTHHHEVVPLHKIYRDRKTINQIYFNSGTWHAIHELALYQPMQQRFVHFHVMSYLAFFKDDERSGRPFETWSGTLGEK